MAVDLTNRHFVKEIDFTPTERMGLVGLTHGLKAGGR